MDVLGKQIIDLFFTLENIKNKHKVFSDFYYIVRMCETVDRYDNVLKFNAPNQIVFIPDTILKYESEMDLYLILEGIIINDEMKWYKK